MKFSGGSMVGEHSVVQRSELGQHELLWQRLEWQRRLLCAQVVHGEQLRSELRKIRRKIID